MEEEAVEEEEEDVEMHQRSSPSPACLLPLPTLTRSDVQFRVRELLTWRGRGGDG